MIPRRLEPEVMDTPEEAADYDQMDHADVNRRFVAELLTELSSRDRLEADLHWLDVGTGTAQIPIEFCRASPVGRVTAIDLANEMLIRARANIDAAGLEQRIALQQCDSKRLPFADASFTVVASNSMIHHIPEPRHSFAQMLRVLRPGGLLFLRDLLRPETNEQVEQLVKLYAGGENDHSQQMFRQSLQAALTLDELRESLGESGISFDLLRQTSDRHWTLQAWLGEQIPKSG